MATDSIRLLREREGCYLVLDGDKVIGRASRRGSKWKAWVQVYEWGKPAARMINGGLHDTRRDAVAEVLILRED